MAYTFITMRWTDGRRSLYEVWRGEMDANGAIAFNVPTSQLLDRFYVTPEDRQNDREGHFHRHGSGPCYPCVEGFYASEDAPPVPWPSHQEHNCILWHPGWLRCASYRQYPDAWWADAS